MTLRILGYKVKEPLEFVNGKLLIYSSRKSVLRTLKDYFVYLAAMGILAYMLYNRVSTSLLIQILRPTLSSSTSTSHLLPQVL